MRDMHISKSDLLDVASLPPATVISVARGPYRHFGLLTEHWVGTERSVLSLNPGPHQTQLREERISLFCRGRPAKLESRPSSLPASTVLARARSGKHGIYSWTQFNCEHFVRFAFGVPIDSPQLRAFMAMGAVVAAMFALKRQT